MTAKIEKAQTRQVCAQTDRQMERSKARRHVDKQAAILYSSRCSAKLDKMREERQECRTATRADKSGRLARRCANMQATGRAETQTNREASKL